MKFKDLKLSTKQLIGFGFILIILAGVNIFSIHKMAILKSEIDEVSTNWLPRAVAISEINRSTSNLRINQLQHAFTKEDSARQEQANNMIQLIDKININLDTYEQLKTESENRNLYSEEERQLFEKFDEKWEEYQDLSFVFFLQLRNNKNEEAVQLLNNEARFVFNEVGSILENLVKINKHDGLEASQRAENLYKRTRFIITILLIITVLFSIFFAGILINYITVPIRQLEKAAKKVTAGDLNVSLVNLSKDEVGCLSESFNQMTKSLRLANRKMEQQADSLKQKNMELESTLKELQETQEQLMIKEKMAALGDLVAGIAHEINNPIGTVKSSTDVFVRCINKIEFAIEKSQSIEELRHNEILPKTFKIFKDNINVTLSAGNRIATIVKSLKNFVRVDESEYKFVDIHEGIESTLTLMENEFRGRINIIKEYGDIPKIGCYPGQLNQVFINVFKNATNAIDKSGTISVKTEHDENNVYVYISDTGKGIASDKINHVFNFGFSSDKKRIKMGSGLATAYNIIQKHHGEIRIDSEINKGTTVHLIVPKSISMSTLKS